MSPVQSAEKEALEEAGVVGKTSTSLLNEYDYTKWGGVCNVKVFPLAVTEILDDWDEKGMRERVIIDIDEAIEKVKPEQKNSIIELKRFLG